MKKTTITLKTLIAGILLAGSVSLISGAALACGPEANKTHMGALLKVDPAQQTFTIQDVQTNSPLTFAANGEIIEGLQGYNGNLMVNYEQTDKGLKAVGVTF